MSDTWSWASVISTKKYDTPSPVLEATSNLSTCPAAEVGQVDKSSSPLKKNGPDFVRDCADDMEERAAIMEYDASDIYPSREVAMTAALDDVIRKEN
jgi:hypothetical protein